MLYTNKPFLLYFEKDFLHNYFDPDTERKYVDAEKWWEKEIMGLLKGEIAW